MGEVKQAAHYPDIPHSIPAVAIFTRTAVPGKTKTRLIPALGPKGAAEFHRVLLSDAVRKVKNMRGSVARHLFVAGGMLPDETISTVFQRQRQKGRNLGERLDRAFAELLRRHSRAIIIGTDSPELPPSILRVALGELLTSDAVLGPCPDGGYYLIGLRRTVKGIFSRGRLGTEFAFRDALDRLLEDGFSCSILEPYPDIDRPQDLFALKKLLAQEPTARRLMPQTWQFLSKIG